jgi:TolB-like protein/DNA-binding winged helix-turn-helix (wHTH) protein
LNEGAGRPEAQTPAPTHRSQSRSQVGRWVVDPDIDEISSPGQVVKLEPRTMRLLLYLMEHRHRVVALKELLDHVWANVVVTPQSVYSTIAQLRQALGDSTDSPAYIATVPRKGYRLLATVTALPADATARAAVAAVATASATTSSPAAVASAGRRPPWSLALLACLIGILILIYQHDLRRLPSPATPPVPAASIAVMPFLDLSEKQDAPYLADGMTEELIDILAHDQMLRVPARTSSFYFKGRTETVAAIASQLNVANLLEGSVRRSDGKIRVTAQLIRASDGFHLWSETYTRSSDDVLTVEDDIAQAVAKILEARLTPGLRSASGERASSAAHNLSLECQLYRERNTVADADKAVDCFHRLIDLNSDSARAWAAYADALMRQPMLANAAIEAQRAGAIESVKAARRALGLDPDSATAHAVIANYLRIFEHDWSGAEREINAALAADPDDATTLLAATGLAKDLGHLDEFIALCERARSNDPLNFQPYARLAGAYLYLGRLGEAEAMARRRLDLAPAGSGSRAGLAEVLLARGQAQAALVEIAQEPLDELRSFGYAKIYDALGRRAEADAALNDVTARFSDRNPTHIAETLAFRGDTDRAFEFLDRAAASGDREILGIKSNFYFRRMHADPRYRRILERVSLPVSQ